jgi:hypothetical protein
MVLAVLVGTALSGCSALDPISHPPVDLEVQPLEVVVNSSSRPEDPYLLNIGMVKRGEHASRSSGSPGSLGCTSSSTSAGRSRSGPTTPGSAIETNETDETTILQGEGEGSGPPAHLEAGTCSVRCRPGNRDAGEATLRVGPAG